MAANGDKRIRDAGDSLTIRAKTRISSTLAAAVRAVADVVLSPVNGNLVRCGFTLPADASVHESLLPVPGPVSDDPVG